MAGNSLESLLAWMKDESRMLGWDLIVALDGHKINLGLQQDHIGRLSQGSDLGIFSGSIDIRETNISHYLSDFRLAAPMLSFDAASLQTDKTALSLSVVGGTQMLVETVQGQKRILSLTALDPLDGSQVTLNLPIRADARNVVLDLKDSEEVLLTMFNTPTEQRATGALFKTWFEGMVNEQRVHTLGKFPAEGNPLMFTRRVDVRTQQRDGPAQRTSAINENGAVVLFASMVDGGSGAFPGNNSGFKYLIPDDDAQRSYSATELFSLALIHRAAYGHAVLQLLDGAEFDHVADGEGALAKLVARGGTLQLAAGNYQSLDFEFESQAFALPAAEGALPLTVEFKRNQVTQRWQSMGSVPFRYRPLGGTTWKNYTAVFNINLQHEFRLWADESGISAMEGELSTPYTDTHEVDVVSGLPPMDSNELEQIKDFVANTVKRAMLERFSNTLTTTASESYLDGVDIIGASTLQASHVALPFDLALFGQINPSASSFSIVQQQPLVVAGETLQMITEPERSGLLWTVENLSGNTSNPGRIDEQGLYQAPPAHAIEGSFNRVLVVATDTDTAERSLALLTVQANPITINPQIQVCFFNDEVELSAGDLHGGDLRWSINNFVPGESGKLVVSTQPEGDHTYIAGPQVANKNYVLDEIKVQDGQGLHSKSAYVLVVQKTPVIVVKPMASPGAGQVQLQAYFDGEPMDGQWWLPTGGSGSIDDTGLYMDDPMAKERCVLVFVSVELLGRTFQGHIILPLPLDDFTFVIGKLAE